MPIDSLGLVVDHLGPDGSHLLLLGERISIYLLKRFLVLTLVRVAGINTSLFTVTWSLASLYTT